jgi:hypothetical protein
MPHVTPQCLRRSAGDNIEGEVQRHPNDELAAGAGRILRCRRCRNPVTAESARININGRHDHHCVNPHGYRFHIGCFGTAPGCEAFSTPTHEFTWFAGFAWRHALCRFCGTHLGWSFTAAGSESFFGLVLDRLTAEEGGPQ